MVKAHFTSRAEFEAEAAAAVVSLLNDVPALIVDDVVREPAGNDMGIDFKVEFTVDGVHRLLLAEVKTSGSPKSASNAIHRLISYQARQQETLGNHEAGLIFVAPYLSPQVREMCRDFEVNYCDLLGNARVVLPGLYINREVAERPAAEKRELRSLFKPKSARVLRYLLKPGQTPRRLNEIAEATQVSIGQVHKLKTAMLERDWIEETSDGFIVRNPDLMLYAWRSENDPPPGEKRGYYTTLHGSALERAVLDAVRRAEGHAVLAGRMAAEFHSPWLITNAPELYADAEGVEQLVQTLGLEPALKGPNVWVTVLDDDGPMIDAVEVAPGLKATGLVQTWLDLSRGGDRDREAAEHLWRERLSW